MDPLDIPATNKVKIQKVTQFDDVQYKKGKLHIEETDRKRPGSSPAPTTKKRKIDDVGVYVKKTSKEKPQAYVQFSQKMLNKRKRVKVANTIDKIIKTAKTGVLKGLKARKHN